MKIQAKFTTDKASKFHQTSKAINPARPPNTGVNLTPAASQEDTLVGRTVLVPPVGPCVGSSGIHDETVTVVGSDTVIVVGSQVWGPQVVIVMVVSVGQ